MAQSRNLVQCPGDMTMQELSFTAGLQPQAEITVDKLVFSMSLVVLEGVGISADPTAQGELLPCWWVNHV